MNLLPRNLHRSSERVPPTSSRYRAVTALLAWPSYREMTLTGMPSAVRSGPGGAGARTYVMRAAAARISADDVAKMSPEQHLQAFLPFVAGLIGDAERYLARPHVDPVRDGASYNLAGMWLDNGEFVDFLRDLFAVVQPRAANPPRTGRTQRVLATVLLPGETVGGRTATELPPTGRADDVARNTGQERSRA